MLAVAVAALVQARAAGQQLARGLVLAAVMVGAIGCAILGVVWLLDGLRPGLGLLLTATTFAMWTWLEVARTRTGRRSAMRRDSRGS